MNDIEKWAKAVIVLSDQICKLAEDGSFEKGEYRTVSTYRETLQNLKEALDKAPNDFTATKWYRVLDIEGRVWCETSVHGEALAHRKPGMYMQRLYERTTGQWRNV